MKRMNLFVICLCVAFAVCSAKAASPAMDPQLSKAVRDGDLTRVLDLVSHGADVAAVDSEGRTVLHLAAGRLRADVIPILVAAGADVDARDAEGRTALHVAAGTGPDAPEVDRLLTRVAAALLDAGADANALDASGATPLRYALDRGHTSVAALLRDHGAEAIPAAPVTPRAVGYRTYAEIGPLLLNAETNYPALCRRYDLGLSASGSRHIWALLITDNPDVEEDEPEFCYISTIHGNEWIGMEMCLYFIDYLTGNYGTDPEVTDLVNSVEIWIVPLMNPDGFDRNPPTRTNAQGIDLNRSFPCPFTSPSNTTTGRPAETAAIMNWSFDQSFTLAANFHTGTMVVNYPFDGNASGQSVDTPSPDDDLFEWISREYSQHNLPMWNSPYFDDGITNGAAWYVIYGGMQDWAYRYMGANEVTIELSDDFIPPATQIPTYWSDNRESMLAYLETCLIGVRGVVTDAATSEPVFATVRVTGRDHDVYTDPDVGDYHRMLLPGSYDLEFEADGFDPVLETGVHVDSGDAVRVDVAMPRPAVVQYPNGGEALAVGRPAIVEWTGNPSARFQVQQATNASDVGLLSDDFESGGLGGDYATGGDAIWFVTNGDAYGGSWSARSGDIVDNQLSVLTRTVVCTAPAELRFWYRVSSEDGYDYLRFDVGGDVRLSASGETGWVEFTTTVPAGVSKLHWTYDKDNSVSEGADAAWVDDFEMSWSGAIWTDIIALTEPGATSVSWTPTAAGDDCAVRVRAIYDSGVEGDWDASDSPFVVEDAAQGDFDGDGDVDTADFAVFSQCFGGSANPPAASCPAGINADLDGDGDVDAADFVLFGQLFTGSL